MTEDRVDDWSRWVSLPGSIKGMGLAYHFVARCLGEVFHGEACTDSSLGTGLGVALDDCTS